MRMRWCLPPPRGSHDAGATAPAHGLYLAGVRYDDFDSYRAVDIAP